MARPIRNIRDDVMDAVEHEIVSKDYLISAMLQWMNLDDVKAMLHANDIQIMTEDDDNG